MKIKMHSALLFCTVFIISDSFVIKDTTAKAVCSKRNPCGWQVYKPYDRINEYFMVSPCDCPPDTRCKQWKDDISISAWVYRCQ